MSAPSSDRAGIRQVIRALKAGGYAVTRVSVGDDEPEPCNVASETSVIEAATCADLSWVYFRSETSREQWVFFVLGNDPEEVVNDFTCGDPTFDKIVSDLVESW